MPEQPVCMVSLTMCACVYVGNSGLSYYQGNPEIGDSIRAGHVIQRQDLACVLTTVASNSTKHFLKVLLYLQNFEEALSLDVCHRETGCHRPSKILR